MCDTLVALGNSTKNGQVLFAKNSDRDPGEAAEVLIVPAADFASGDDLRATHISIPQVGHTNAVFLCKPAWIWGAEMGANEFGVTIGNETVWAAEPVREDDGLIGMDLLRLALERADTARGAVDVIAGLLDQYGQGGNAGYRHPFFYHNGYLVADPREAWAIESVGKYWIAEQVKDIYSISNTISIRGQGDLRHPDLIAHAVDEGWCPNTDEFDFAIHYLPQQGTKEEGAHTVTRGCDRARRSLTLLNEKKGNIDEAFLMRVLRDHGDDPDWTPAKNRSMGVLCLHAGDDMTPSQTTNSLVSVLENGIQVHWATVGSAPCTALFKPFFMPTSPPELGTPTPNKYDPASTWWQHEELHRLVLLDYGTRLPVYQADRDALEARFLQETRVAVEDANAALTAGEDIASTLGEFSSKCFSNAMTAEADWIAQVRDTPVHQKVEAAYRLFWKKLNKMDEMPEIA